MVFKSKLKEGDLLPQRGTPVGAGNLGFIQR